MPIFTAADPEYKHKLEYFANLIKKHLPSRNLTDLLYETGGADSEYWKLVNLGTIPDALGSFRNNTPTAGASAGAGTTPPAPVISANSKDYSGQITFGTGTTPAAGNMLTATYGGGAWPIAPFVQITPANAATAALGLYISGYTTTGFTVGANVAPAASQGNTTYAFHYRAG